MERQPEIPGAGFDGLPHPLFSRRGDVVFILQNLPRLCAPGHIAEHCGQRISGPACGGFGQAFPAGCRAAGRGLQQPGFLQSPLSDRGAPRPAEPYQFLESQSPHG